MVVKMEIIFKGRPTASLAERLGVGEMGGGERESPPLHI